MGAHWPLRAAALGATAPQQEATRQRLCASGKERRSSRPPSHILLVPLYLSLHTSSKKVLGTLWLRAFGALNEFVAIRLIGLGRSSVKRSWQQARE
jgi:hypothetical protein